jgi:branched-subunit amino acid aminotransferase/4-amino-4-deoxychorismate lyase
MIWVGGEIVPDETLAIAAADRVFEHGLGLFETLRTWDGVPALLARHLARLTRSATALGLPLDPGALPDPYAIARLRQAHGALGDVVLRITLSGGRAERGGSTLWMRPAPLPPLLGGLGAVVVPAAWTLSPDDPLSRHKTLNYWSRRLAHERGRALGADEVLFSTPDGQICEGSRMYVFLVHGTTLSTPALDGPILPGIMRGLVLELAPGVGLSTCERGVTEDDLLGADEVFLTNAVRGLVPVGRTPRRTFAVPGAWTRRLMARIDRWIAEGPHR